MIKLDLADPSALRVPVQLLNLCDTAGLDLVEPYQLYLLHFTQIQQDIAEHGIDLLHNAPRLRVGLGCFMGKPIAHHIQSSNFTENIRRKERADLQADP